MRLCEIDGCSNASGGRSFLASYNVYDYDPRCKRCHNIYDNVLTTDGMK